MEGLVVAVLVSNITLCAVSVLCPTTALSISLVKNLLCVTNSAGTCHQAVCESALGRLDGHQREQRHRSATAAYSVTRSNRLDKACHKHSRSRRNEKKKGSCSSSSQTCQSTNNNPRTTSRPSTLNASQIGDSPNRSTEDC